MKSVLKHLHQELEGVSQDDVQKLTEVWILCNKSDGSVLLHIGPTVYLELLNILEIWGQKCSLFCPLTLYTKFTCLITL